MQVQKKHHKTRGNEKLLPYTKINAILFIAGLGMLALGYAALAVKPWSSFISLNIAPVLLVAGYCVVIPAAILYHKKEEKTSAPQAQSRPENNPPAQ